MEPAPPDRRAAPAAAPPPPETVYVARRRVACDGGGALGHPRVWYALDDGVAECGYCDRRFVYDPQKASR